MKAIRITLKVLLGLQLIVLAGVSIAQTAESGLSITGADSPAGPVIPIKTVFIPQFAHVCLADTIVETLHYAGAASGTRGTSSVLDLGPGGYPWFLESPDLRSSPVGTGNILPCRVAPQSTRRVAGPPTLRPPLPPGLGALGVLRRGKDRLRTPYCQRGKRAP